MNAGLGLDTLPIHWNALFQITALITVFLVLYQIATSQKLDAMRRHDVSRLVFHLRRGSLIVMLLTMLWAVIYVHDNGWQPWPPIVLFLIAYNVQVASHVIVMRCDIAAMTTRRVRVAGQQRRDLG